MQKSKTTRWKKSKLAGRKRERERGGKKRDIVKRAYTWKASAPKCLESLKSSAKVARQSSGRDAGRQRNCPSYGGKTLKRTWSESSGCVYWYLISCLIKRTLKCARRLVVIRSRPIVRVQSLCSGHYSSLKRGRNSPTSFFGLLSPSSLPHRPSTSR